MVPVHDVQVEVVPEQVLQLSVQACHTFETATVPPGQVATHKLPERLVVVQEVHVVEVVDQVLQDASQAMQFVPLVYVATGVSAQES